MVIGTRVPAPGGLFDGALASFPGRFGELRAALLRMAALRSGVISLRHLDQERQCGFRVGRDGEVHFVVAPEILIVALAEKIAGGNRDQLRAGLSDALALHAHAVHRRLGVGHLPQIGHLKAEHDIRGPPMPAP